MTNNKYKHFFLIDHEDDFLFGIRSTFPNDTDQSSPNNIPSDVKSKKIYQHLTWHNYEELTKELKSLEQRYSDYLTLYSLSEKSVEGRDLWVMKISTDNGTRSDLKPMIKYVANIHGNEPTGRELCLALIEYLVDSYKKVSHCKYFFDMHILIG